MTHYRAIPTCLISISMVSAWTPPAVTTCSSSETQVTVAQGQANLNTYAATYTDLAGWQRRAQTIRDGMLTQMMLTPLPKRNPLNTVIYGKKTFNGYSVENVYFESLTGFFVTGNLYRPIAGTAPFPAVMRTHGHSQASRFDTSLQVQCATFARMGAMCFTWEMVGYGESDQTTHCYPNILALHTWNTMRVVDFLLSLGVVDSTRIAMTGESGGGTQTFMATPLEPRIKMSIPVVQVSSYFPGGCLCESGMNIHKGATFETNNAEIAAMAAPRPFCDITEGQQWTRNTPTIEFPYIARVYGLYGATSMAENAHFANEGHDYGPSKRAAAYAFVAKHFGLLAAPPESQVTKLPADSLKVFNASHPRPSYALTTNAQITSALMTKETPILRLDASRGSNWIRSGRNITFLQPGFHSVQLIAADGKILFSEKGLNSDVAVLPKFKTGILSIQAER